jgi:hypothetical protein
VGKELMSLRNLVKVLLAISLCAGTATQASSQNAPGSKNGTCVVKEAGVQFNCPAGWKIVEENERGTTIGNFDRPDQTGNLTVPVGRATLMVHPMPKIYRNFKEWVYAATKNAPEAIQNDEALMNRMLGTVNVISFRSPDSQRGLAYASYFFEINGTPVNIELNYPRTSKNASDYRAIPSRIIQNLEPYQR